MILELLLRLTREQKTATIVATHSLEATSVCDTLVKLRDGRVEEVTRR
jgi:ABC-type lipoprotein export system ATPase subunit